MRTVTAVYPRERKPTAKQHGKTSYAFTVRDGSSVRTFEFTEKKEAVKERKKHAGRNAR